MVGLRCGGWVEAVGGRCWWMVDWSSVNVWYGGRVIVRS